LKRNAYNNALTCEKALLGDSSQHRISTGR
jgi:hypothetical protein